MESYNDRLHLAAKDPTGDLITCQATKYGWNVQRTRVVADVECVKCLEALLKERARNKAYHAHMEMWMIYFEHNHLIEKCIARADKNRIQIIATNAEANRKKKEAISERKRKQQEGTIPGRRDYPPIHAFEMRENDYGGHECCLPAGVLDAAFQRASNGTTVDCDEWTLNLRLQRGRDLRNPAAWGLIPQTLTQSNTRDEEYWEW